MQVFEGASEEQKFQADFARSKLGEGLERAHQAGEVLRKLVMD